MALTDLGPFYDSEGNDITDEVLAQAQGQTGNQPGWRKALEEDAQKGKEAVAERNAIEARALAAERKAALLEAGVDVNSDLGKFFADSYKGEATVEAIKEAAGKIGLIPMSQSPQVQAEMQGLERVANAGASNPALNQTLTPEQQIDAFQGTREEFDDFVRQFGTNVETSNAGAQWDKSPTTEIVTPR